MTGGELIQRATGLVLLILALPLIAFLAVLVLCSVGRPVFFTQRRSGIGARPFRLIKLRTMTNARGPDGHLLPDDERITRVGRLLRRTRLDELPELINIARGEMAFVGPRPLLPETIAEMGKGGAIRATVLPGLTGWSQVSGNTLLSQRRKLELDLWYVENRSLALDLRILWMTVTVVVFGERLADRPETSIGSER